MKLRILVSLVLIALGAVTLNAQDLPYSSGSTGADGDLIIPQNYPSQAGWSCSSVTTDPVEGALYYSAASGVWKSLDGTNWSYISTFSPSQWNSQYRYEIAYHVGEGALYGLGTPRPSEDAYQLYKKNVDHTWTAVGAEFPSGNNTHGAALTYHSDTSGSYLLLFGIGATANETWTFDGTTWTKLTPTNVPSGRVYHQMTYDPARQETVLFGGIGLSDTWVWKNGNWTQKTTFLQPPAMDHYTMVYHPGYSGIVLPNNEQIWIWNGTDWTVEYTTGGFRSTNKQGMGVGYVASASKLVAVSPNNQVLTLRDGIWSFANGNPYYIDLTQRANGVYNYGNITIPAGVTVKFLRNGANTPVVWLASGFVSINGTVDVSAEGTSGGPGGYDGATGLMTVGGGPGGGNQSAPWDSTKGRYFGVYGNVQIQPLIGGSGGGSHSYQAGGGGGGAILIAASRDILLGGSILAHGSPGPIEHIPGSGGAIKLIADRVVGSGSLSATGAYSGRTGLTGGVGRIRLEAYEQTILPNTNPMASTVSTPVWNSSALDTQTQYQLTVTQVAGTSVPVPPRGSGTNPDVSFSSDQPVTINVSGVNIPDGTPISLRLQGDGINTTLPAEGDPAVTMNSGTAQFSVTIPTGIGYIQAFCNVAGQ